MEAVVGHCRSFVTGVCIIACMLVDQVVLVVAVIAVSDLEVDCGPRRAGRVATGTDQAAPDSSSALSTCTARRPAARSCAVMYAALLPLPVSAATTCASWPTGTNVRST